MGQPVDGLIGLLLHRHDLPGGIQQHPALRSGHKAATLPPEQRRAQLLLQPLHKHRKGRLRNLQQPTRGGKAACFFDGQQILHASHVHARSLPFSVLTLLYRCEWSGARASIVFAYNLYSLRWIVRPSFSL